MDAEFFKNNPFRRPQWRADRVMQMVEHRPSPLRPRGFDDHYVRSYRNFLLAYVAAGDDEGERYAAFFERPHLHRAHLLYSHPDPQWRQILEARILTGESSDEIAERLATETETIDYYEKLFFNVRDRMHHSDWIAKIILGPPEDRAANQNGVMTEGQQGFVYRLFGYHGGPLALDAMISGMVPKSMPQRAEDVAAWFNDALGQIVQTRAAAAASSLEINKYNVMHLLDVAVDAQHAATAGRIGTKSPQTDLDQYAEKIVANLDWFLAEQMLPGVHETRQIT